MHQKSTGMKKFLEKIIEGILTCSGFVTSITILLIVLFLFTEAFGLFRSKVIEEGYVLALNKSNKVSVLSPGFSSGGYYTILYGGGTRSCL